MDGREEQRQPWLAPGRALRGSEPDVVRAAGGVLWRVTPGGRELVIIHRSRYGDWALPKGKVNPGESDKAAAVREVQEETGYRVRVLGPAGMTVYRVDYQWKEVRFWIMETTDHTPVGTPDSTEVDTVVSLPLQTAIERLDHAEERQLLARLGNERS